jgi:hypothetical protein
MNDKARPVKPPDRGYHCELRSAWWEWVGHWVLRGIFYNDIATHDNHPIEDGTPGWTTKVFGLNSPEEHAPEPNDGIYTTKNSVYKVTFRKEG